MLELRIALDCAWQSWSMSYCDRRLIITNTSFNTLQLLDQLPHYLASHTRQYNRQHVMVNHFRGHHCMCFLQQGVQVTSALFIQSTTIVKVTNVAM